MKEFFQEMLEYGHHYNQKLADIFTENPDKTSEKSVKLFSHILNAHQIWNNRILPQQPAFGIWHIHPVQNLKAIDDANHQHALQVLNNFDINDLVNYTNIKGQPYSNTIRDIFFHTINHGTYHRAQIATEFKLHGLEPLITDYIFYKWQMQ